MKISSALTLAFSPIVLVSGFQFNFPNSYSNVATNKRSEVAPVSFHTFHPIGRSNNPRTIVYLSPDLNDYESLLAEIIFSQQDPREEIAKNYEKYDENFLQWLDSKINQSQDLDERAGLGSLKEMIVKVGEKLEEMAAQIVEQEDVAAAPSAEIDDAPVTPRSNQEVFQEMRAMQQIDNEKDIEAEKERQRQIMLEVEAGYNAMVDEIISRASSESIVTAVAAIYEKVDLKFMQLVKAKAEVSETEEEKAKFQEILDEIGNIQAQRMASAAEKLQQILSSGNPQAMQAEIAKLATAGSVDEPLILLLEANINQAKAAGVMQAVEVMEMLKNRAQMELDRQLPAPKKLLRSLLRTEDKDARKKILENAFMPKEQLVLASHDEQKEATPDVAPPDFIQECKTLISQYGNADEEGTIMSRIQDIIDDAERIASDFFGNTLSPRDQQDRMWNEGTKSVFDLETMELQAEVMGEKMPWQNDAYDDLLPDQVKSVVKQKGGFDIGGSEGF